MRIQINRKKKKKMRVRKAHIHINLFDKVKGILEMEREMYKKMASMHIEKVNEVGWKAIEAAHRLERFHTRSIIKIFGLGH